LEKTSECGLRAHNGTVGETLRSPIEPSVTLPMVHATECQLSRRVFGDKEDFYFFSFLEKRNWECGFGVGCLRCANEMREVGVETSKNGASGRKRQKMRDDDGESEWRVANVGSSKQ